MREQSHGGPGQDGLVPVELTGTESAADSDNVCGLVVVLSGGGRIEVGAGFHAATLKRLIHLIESM
jgi:hypothetical protein